MPTRPEDEQQEPWPRGDGDMAKRIRALDWASTPLGPRSNWPARLKAMVDLALSSIQPIYVAAGPNLTLIYNDAYNRLIMPDGLGAPMRTLFGPQWGEFNGIVEEVLTGVPHIGKDQRFSTTWRSDEPEGWFSFALTPLQEESGQIIGFVGIAIETTAQVRTQRAMRVAEERQRYLLRLSDALRPLAEVKDVRRVACELLGRELRAERVYYVDYDTEAGFGLVGDDYRVEGFPSLAGRYPFEAFRTTYERVATGTIWIVTDVAMASELAPREREFFQQQGVTAFIDVPLLKAGKLRAVLCVVQSTPREWTDADTAMAVETAERTWAAMERARAETDLRTNEQQLRIALEAGRMGTYRLDLNSSEQIWSDQQYEIFGLTKGAEVPTRELFLSLVHPDDQHLINYTPDDIRNPGTFLDSEFRIVRPDGEVRWVSAHALALFGADGRPAQLIGVNQDVTEQRRLEAAMHTSEERLRQFSETMTDVMWIRRASDLQWEFLSPAFHKIYGISRQDALRGDNYLSWSELIVPEDRAKALASIERVRAGERVTFEYRIRRPEDGQVRWLRNTDFPMRESGQVLRIGGIGHDITPLKEAEEHQKLLTAELQHRVRNTLAVVRSIARRTAASSVTVDDFAMNLEGRIDAFARVQAVVTRDPSAGVDLAMLVAEELRAASSREGKSLSIDGPTVRLLAKPAATVALGIHELVTNAIKHGALLSDTAHIDVRWTSSEDGVHFRWKETGVAAGAPSTRRGLGTEILTQTLPYELGGQAQLVLQNDGMFYSLAIPSRNLVAS